MSKVTDLVRYNHSKATADTYYNLDPGCIVDGESDKLKWYHLLKDGLTQNQDDETFGRHNINFSNKWGVMDGQAPYMTKKVKEAEGEVDDVDIQQVDSTPIDDEIDSL